MGLGDAHVAILNPGNTQALQHLFDNTAINALMCSMYLLAAYSRHDVLCSIPVLMKEPLKLEGDLQQPPQGV